MIKSSSVKIFPDSNNPKKWIDWMFYYIYLPLFTIMTIRGWSRWFIFFVYITTNLIHLGALFSRKKQFFFPCMCLTASLVVVELVYFFMIWDDGFTFGAVMSAFFIFFIFLFLLYATYSNFMMWKYYPQALDHSDNSTIPMMDH